MPEIPLGTVVGPQGPPGPKGDTGTFSPEDLQRISDLEADKVDKVSGKGLSTNDYTTADKNAVATIGNKVDKVTGKGLSTNDYTTADKNKLSGIPADANKTLIDATLSNAGQAADAKATGDKFSALQSLIRRMEIHCTASGNPATFSDADAANVKALSVTITPTQSGSGTPSPSNVRPISGVSSVSVTRTGKNLLPFGSASFTLSQYVNLPATISPGTYTLSASVVSSDTDSNDSLAEIGGLYIFFTRNSRQSKTFTLSVPISGFRIYAGHDWNKSQGNTATWSNIQLEAGDIATDYEAPNPQTVTVQLTDGSNPLTVYGGTLNVTTGELTVTDVSMELDGSADEKWNKNTYVSNDGDYLYYARFSEMSFPNPASVAGILCNYATTQSIARMQAGDVGFSLLPTSNDVILYVSLGLLSPNSTASFKAYLSESPLQIGYRLAEPVTYQLTPQQLATLHGYNAVSTDAASVSVTYKADTSIILSIILGGG